MTATIDAPDPALALVNAAIVARLAGRLGAPRLATAAARRVGVLAGEVVIGLSPAVARTTVEVEEGRLADVRCTGELAALLAPVVEERGGAT